jgi:hypothetical protein
MGIWMKTGWISNQKPANGQKEQNKVALQRTKCGVNTQDEFKFIRETVFRESLSS